MAGVYALAGVYADYENQDYIATASVIMQNAPQVQVLQPSN